MNDGRKRRQAKQARRDARRRAMRPVTEPSRVEVVREALNATHPLDMLLLVGSMIEVLLPHEFSFRAKLSQQRPDANSLIDDAASVSGPEYTAVLKLVSEMAVGDENVQQRCREVATADPDEIEWRLYRFGQLVGTRERWLKAEISLYRDGQTPIGFHAIIARVEEL